MSQTRRIVSDYPLHDHLALRWSPRAFSDRPIEPAVERRLFEAARWAPSSYNEQPWAFLVANKSDGAGYEKLLGCFIEFNQAWAKTAPLLLLAVAHLEFQKNGEPNRHAFYDLGQAVAQLTVQATAEGLFVHQMAGILVDKAQTEFSIPQDWIAATGIAIGYLGDPNQLSESLKSRESVPSPRKPQSAFVFSGTWNNSLA
ncbi:MAG: nitroreductase family protein [Planctomycetota bacterium]